MRLVDAVFQRVEVVAIANVRAGVDLAFLFELGIALERRRVTLAEIGEDQSKILLRRAAADFNFLGKALAFRRLLDALSRAVVFPAMIKTANAILLDPADGKLRATVRAAEIDDVSRPALAAVKRKVLAHNANRHSVTGFQFARNINRLPEHSQIAPGQRARSGANEINAASVSSFHRHGRDPHAVRFALQRTVQMRETPAKA